MIASSWRTKLNKVLPHFLDVPMIRITYEAAYTGLAFTITCGG